ncbi:hypothetical protein PRZ48_000177 [Zasmidium cellare]|uniref:Complex 1 LYR protein domain-containing protein n=1 Tax=Zasmidium cellare TaxID=395010 RepID=A0ABR0EZF3_ZASCE|nr:hypothetical protein PRZ48_000177 [Zasmidium cellare]
MPTFLAPHKSGAHRLAAKSLYRALLAQTRTLPQAPEIRAIIRSRFREQKFNTSTKRLKVCFTAGYEAIDLLDGARVGKARDLGRLKELVKSAVVVDEMRREGWELLEKRGKGKGYVKGGEAIVKREGIRLDERPLPKEKLTGERKVPVLVDAGSIPMLRFTKPQPRALSLYIHSRIKQRQRRHDLRHHLEGMLALAKEEDRWDGLTGRSEEGAWWSWEVMRALGVVQGALNEERRRNGEMAGRMQGVVDREREVWVREWREREEGRVREREGKKEREKGEEKSRKREKMRKKREVKKEAQNEKKEEMEGDADG